MHSRKKGKSGSTKALRKNKPSWSRYKENEIEQLVVKLARSGKSPSQIGIFLRDSYGIYDVKKLTGKKEFWEYDHNVARNKFNDLLKREYAGKESVFDLAKIESTYPDGRRETFKRKDKRFYSLVHDYTHDGAHLKELGRKKVAEQFLIFLANLN